ncbi:MAG: cell division protein FtsQ/DivIB [Williamsia sp.]|nr:cell division protein FtsQ/DivIB [Williamsia sp.]
MINLVWVLLASGVTVLLAAAIDIKNHKTCQQVKISIQGANRFMFLNNHDIIELISQNGINHPVGKSIAACDLQHLQTLLEKNVWVKEARLFFDNNFVLHVLILEREPVGRVFNEEGQSFYIDSSGALIPPGNKRFVVQLPVFTGFPTTGKGDSVLLRQISHVSQYILQDSFWKAQIAQVDITPLRQFEMVPTFGSHLIRFGDGEDYTGKFNRLALFYKTVLRNYGFNRYSTISVEYNNQVIGTKKTLVSRIDSLQALKNIQKLIEESKKVLTDSIPAESIPVESIDKKQAGDSLTDRPAQSRVDIIRSSPKPKDPGKKAAAPKQPAATKKKEVNPVPRATKPKENSTREKPKAVMPKLQ